MTSDVTVTFDVTPVFSEKPADFARSPRGTRAAVGAVIMTINAKTKAHERNGLAGKVVKLVGMSLAAVALAGALGGCSATSADEETALTSSAASLQKPLFVHYGFLQTNPIPVNGKGKAAAKARMKSLIVEGAENVVVSTRPFADPDGAHQAWKSAGGLLAKRIAMEALVTGLDNGKDPVGAALAEGFDFVAIDEIHPKKAAAIDDNGRLRGKFVQLLQAHSDKVILYGASYAMAGSKTNGFMQFKTALNACREHCHAFASEVYLSTAEAFPPYVGRATAGGCANGLRCHGFLVKKLVEAGGKGLRDKIISVIEVRSNNKPAGNAKSYCAPHASGALRREMAKASALGQRGVGTYALTYAASDLKAGAFDAATGRFASCFRDAARYFGPNKPNAARAIAKPASIHTLDFQAGVDEPAGTGDDELFTDPEIAKDLDPESDSDDPGTNIDALLDGANAPDDDNDAAPPPPPAVPCAGVPSNYYCSEEFGLPAGEVLNCVDGAVVGSAPCPEACSVTRDPQAEGVSEVVCR